MKTILLSLLFLTALGCQDEPQTRLPKNAKIVSKAEFDVFTNQDPPTCFWDHGVKYCCSQGGGVICNPQ